jgi:hypothetical protein
MYTNRLIKGRPHRLQRDQWGEGTIKILHEYNSMFISFAHGYASVVSSVYYMGIYNCEDTGARMNYVLWVCDTSLSRVQMDLKEERSALLWLIPTTDNCF